MRLSNILRYGGIYAFLTTHRFTSSFIIGKGLVYHHDVILKCTWLPNRQRRRTSFYSTSSLAMGKPKSGSVVDTYQTVSVNCNKCKTRLFRYKKKNGTKSNLVKCYIERISEDCEGLVANRTINKMDAGENWICPQCDSRFGRDSMIHGRPAIKLVGGKTQMKKK